MPKLSKPMPIYQIIIGFFIAITIRPALADIYYRDSDAGVSRIRREVTITGKISPADASVVRDLLSKTSSKGTAYYVSFELESMGGDVESALDIGDMIYQSDFGFDHKINGKTMRLNNPPHVLVNKNCASACVIIYASSVARSISPWAKLIVHNPYSLDNTKSYRQLQTERAKIKKRSLAQFERVGVSEKLWDFMVKTPSQHAHVLTKNELDELGLSSDDPAYEDHKNGVAALRNKLSKSEYLNRKRTFEICRDRVNANYKLSEGFEVLDDRWRECEKKSGLVEWTGR